MRAEAALAAIEPFAVEGRVVSARGALLEIAGLGGIAEVGAGCALSCADGRRITGEIIGVREARTLALLHEEARGVRSGMWIRLCREDEVRPSNAWLGRVVDAFGRPLDADRQGALRAGERPALLRARPPRAFSRRRVGTRLATGIRVLDSFLPLCRGQRLGIFAGSGVGKSSLLGMLARHMEADVVVCGLIGERGREVNDFLEQALGEEGRRRSVVVVATSDEPPLVKRRAAWLTLAVAEAFRDQGRHVLCLLDSVTRLAEAQREIGLAAGEPPTTKAFPPSTFGELQALLERAGPGRDGTKDGDITAVFTVLVAGDDFDEPVADVVRGTLDGHVVLDRRIAETGRFPAVDLLKSVSRMLPACHDDDENRLIARGRALMSDYAAMETMIRLGAYQAGSDETLDRAIRLRSAIEAFLAQPLGERMPPEETFARLRALLDG